MVRRRASLSTSSSRFRVASAVRSSSDSSNAKSIGDGKQPTQRVVLAQKQPVLRSRGEKPIRLVYPSTDQVVNENADEGGIPTKHHRLPLERTRCGVDPGDCTLASRLLIPGGAVHLARQEKPGNALSSSVELSCVGGK